MVGLLDFIGDDDDSMTALAKPWWAFGTSQRSARPTTISPLAKTPDPIGLRKLIDSSPGWLGKPWTMGDRGSGSTASDSRWGGVPIDGSAHIPGIDPGTPNARRSGSDLRMSWPIRSLPQRAQVLPDNFEIEYTQENLTPDEARKRLDAAADKTYYPSSDGGVSVVLSGNVTKIGDGATITTAEFLRSRRKGTC
jgi:hypothetical protein